MTTESQNILVTGANGLLGKQAILSLQKKHNVHAIVRKSPENPVPNVTYHVLDLGGLWSVDTLPQNIDAIFHLAQSSRFREFPTQALDVFKVNVDSTARLLDYAQKAGTRRFIYASSGGVYGSGAQAFHENSPIIPHGQLGYYLASKLCSEVLVENYASLMTVAVLRFFFMYGPEQKRTMLIPRLIDNVKNGNPIALQGENGISINPIHVSDAVNALEKTLEMKQSATLNVGGPDVLSLREIAEMTAAHVGKSPVFEIAESPGNNLVANIDSMKTILVPPKISLKDSIKEMIAP